MRRMIQRIALLALLPMTVTAQGTTTICAPVPAATETGVVFGTISAGSVYTYTATGTASYDCPGGLYVDPNGMPYGPGMSAGNLANLHCLGLLALSLVGKVNGTCVQLGSSGTFTAQNSGELRLFMNDANGGYYNNCGAWNVCLTGSFSAIPPTLGSGCVLTTQSARHSRDITRTSLYWFTHGYTNDPASITLEQAIAVNGGSLSLGFLCLPKANYVSSNDPAIDAIMEALGFYYNGTGKTGDRVTASALCQARKKMAPELIAAIANNVLLGTTPANASYKNGRGTTNFPPDLIEQAGNAAAGVDIAQIRLLTALLHKFNASGVTNNFYAPLGQVECSPNPRALLRSIARDPTTDLNCPGLNDTCATAEVVVFPNSNPSPLASFQRTVDMRKFASGNVYWKITPALGTAGVQFTANASKSNFSTTLAVLEGQCLIVTSNGNSTVDSSGLTFVAGFNNTGGTGNTSSNSTSVSTVSFVTDGTNTFYIEASGGVGKLRLIITSP